MKSSKPCGKHENQYKDRTKNKPQIFRSQKTLAYIPKITDLKWAKSYIYIRFVHNKQVTYDDSNIVQYVWLRNPFFRFRCMRPILIKQTCWYRYVSEWMFSSSLSLSLALSHIPAGHIPWDILERHIKPHTKRANVHSLARSLVCSRTNTHTFDSMSNSWQTFYFKMFSLERNQINYKHS